MSNIHRIGDYNNGNAGGSYRSMGGGFGMRGLGGAQNIGTLPFYSNEVFC